MFKKIFLLSIFISFLNCTNNDNSEGCIRPANLSFSSDLNNPQFINARVPGGFTELNNEGYKGILLLNVNGSEFVAYDKICPVNDCNSPMTYERGIVLRCQCDDSEYGVGKGIGGAPQTAGFNCPAIEYRVITNGTAIRISNF